MPQKLNVSESLAFLIACIDASGRLDYKRLGDNLEIQPAAARMRLTRLRRAVANREFEDYLLVQPGKLDPEIAAIANPDSRKLNDAASKARKSKHAKRIGDPELSRQFVQDSDAEVEDDPEEGHEDGKKSPVCEASTGSNEANSKRKAVSEPPDESDGDESLFYKDTSSASCRVKQIKLEDDEKGEKKYSGVTIAHADNMNHNTSMQNDRLLQTGDRRSTTVFAGDAHIPVQQYESAMGRGAMLQLPNLTFTQPSKFAQIASKHRYGGHPHIVRSQIDDNAREAYLAQRAPLPADLPSRQGARRMVNGRIIGGGHGWSIWDRPVKQSVSQEYTKPTTQVATSDDSWLSTPASVFSTFQPAKPSVYEVRNQAMQRVNIPRDQQAIMPARKATDYTGLSAVPQYLLDPTLRPHSKVTAELVANGSPKKLPVRPRGFALSRGQLQKMKEEHKASDRTE